MAPMMHEPISPELLYICTACGALILWGKLAKQGRSVYFLSNILDLYISRVSWRRGIEPILFVALGTFIAVMVIDPRTGAQAFAAGLGWTGLTSK
jgi:hypothetical protein